MNTDNDHKLIDALSKAMISEIRTLGRIQQIITGIYRSDVFDGLGKHDAAWQHDDPNTEQRLLQYRARLLWIQDQLDEISNTISETI